MIWSDEDANDTFPFIWGPVVELGMDVCGAGQKFTSFSKGTSAETREAVHLLECASALRSVRGTIDEAHFNACFHDSVPAGVARPPDGAQSNGRRVLPVIPDNYTEGIGGSSDPLRRAVRYALLTLALTDHEAVLGAVDRAIRDIATGSRDTAFSTSLAEVPRLQTSVPQAALRTDDEGVAELLTRVKMRENNIAEFEGRKYADVARVVLLEAAKAANPDTGHAASTTIRLLREDGWRRHFSS